ncbi:GDSL esterase/lipase At1g54790-like isoform X2 [Rhododendron vialii]|uniref:GDSL esterase/lipase At1g54790-like isoform X2 n=1 Tax=Rhododendron vialii TaxID=182163 RepID=UPI00265F0BAA|nr:GDSL esterase/lipase At1g54790-like isoform X2 [Rhododendron vialii]
MVPTLPNYFLAFPRPLKRKKAEVMGKSCSHLSPLPNSMALELIALSTTITLISSCLPFASPSNFSYPAIFNFGDSNSDTGGLVAGIAFPVGPPNGQTYFLEPSGRLCDGRLTIDFLMGVMGMPFLNPYLDSVGAPDFKTGCNFATGGSTILPAKAIFTSPFSFGIQVAQFIRFKTRVHELLTQDEELQNFLPLEEYFRLGLYMFDIGQNDLDYAFYLNSEDQVFFRIPTIVQEFETGIKELYYQGARNFWIHNTGPLGCLPRIIATFGFKQSLAACCGYGGLPLNFDNRIACGETKNLNGSFVTAKPCNNTAEYVNWDGNHYTEAANLYVSSQILTGKYSQSPLLADSHFLARSEY